MTISLIVFFLFGGRLLLGDVEQHAVVVAELIGAERAALGEHLVALEVLVLARRIPRAVDAAAPCEILDLLLTLRSIPHVSPLDTRAEIDRLVRAAPPGDPARLPLIVMMRDECWQMTDRRHFQRVSERYRLRELYLKLPSYYAVYRYVPAGQPGNCAPATGPEPGE